jgi:hypothetical protein
MCEVTAGIKEVGVPSEDGLCSAMRQEDAKLCSGRCTALPQKDPMQ